MSPIGSGWYVFLAMNATDEVATDRFGPFSSNFELVSWLVEHRIAYRPGASFFKQSPLYFGEMTGDEADGYWATGIHEVRVV